MQLHGQQLKLGDLLPADIKSFTKKLSRRETYIVPPPHIPARMLGGFSALDVAILNNKV